MNSFLEPTTLLKMNFFLNRAVGRSPKCIRKSPARRIQKNLRNINWYSCYELFKAGKIHTILVSFMILPGLALLRGIQDIFEYYSSTRAKRGVA